LRRRFEPRATFRAPQERDAAIERWLREEVAPTYDAVKADPSSVLSLQQVAAELRGHHARRLIAKA
jgi:antitoxin ParD1/3/4